MSAHRTKLGFSFDPRFTDDKATCMIYESRRHRDRVNAKVMNGAAMPFDGKRMIFGGFKPMVEL